MGKVVDVRVAANGRMVLPKSVRKVLGLHGDGKVIVHVDGDGVRLTSVEQAIGRAQDLYRRHATVSRTTDDFLADRKAEADADQGASR